MYPNTNSSKALCEKLYEKYDVPVTPVNCLELEEEDIKEILTKILFEFPVREIGIDLPKWVSSLSRDHWLRSSTFSAITEMARGITHIREVKTLSEKMCECEYIENAYVSRVDLGNGTALVYAAMNQELFYKVLAETTGLEISDEQGLMACMLELAQMKREYDKFKGALDEVEATGYGIVMPTMEELTLDEPEIMRQGGRYGVRLRASAPSIHMMKADITTEVAPLVGTESQSEELVMYLLREFEENPGKIWESNIFGKSLHELVNEGLHNKLFRMPVDARMKLQETIEKIINEGCSGLICIIL